jgi:hypothetical protein
MASICPFFLGEASYHILHLGEPRGEELKPLPTSSASFKSYESATLEFQPSGDSSLSQP